MKYVVGNWKMYCNISEARELVSGIADGLQSTANSKIKVILCPPFTVLGVVKAVVGSPTFAKATAGKQLAVCKLGAQNCHFMPCGAYTGEISPAQLKDFCEYVILGHSERRKYFGEDDVLINKKIKAALENTLKPIVCVGEWKRGDSTKGIFRQVQEAIAGLKEAQIKNLIFAYEPVWAIGTGEQPEPSYANEIIKEIKEITREETPVLYGGSVDDDNVKNFVSQPDVDGFLVGGASIKAKEFLKIIKEVAKNAE